MNRVTYNGQGYSSREEAEQARAKDYAEQTEKLNRQRYAEYIDAYSVGFDKNKYDALIASGRGVSQISENEANYIRSKFTPSYSTKYKNSATDQYLASVGLPPSADLSKYREQYTNYTSGGGLKDNYGNLTSENWSKINELWSRDWQYGLSDEDARRKYYGLAPTSYDSEYADTLLDDELKAAGLPPSKLLNGKLGEKYSQWISDNDSYNEFMSDVVRTKVKNSESRTNPVMPNIDGSLPEYTIEQAIQDTLVTDKWRLWGNEHYGVKQDMPDLYSGEYTVMDKYGYTPQKDERGNIVYDYDKWNKDSIKAAENNAKIDADEFAITAEKAQVFYDKYASDAKAEKEAEDELITSKQFREITLDKLFNTTAGGGDVPVLPTQNWLTEEQRLRYQPVVDKLNTIAKEEGWDAATEYWNSGSLQRDLVNSDIVASYRQEYEDVPSYADKTDEEILNEYYGGIAKSYGMSSEQEAALRNGSLTLSDYMSDKVNTDADAWEFANARMEREYGSKSDVEKQLENARYFYRTIKNADLKKAGFKEVKELEKTLEEYETIREGYYIDAIGYSKSFTGNEVSGDLNEKVRDVITPVLTQKYDSAKGTNDRINLVLENATDEEKQKVLYLADVKGTGSAVILGREEKSLTNRYIEALVSKYSNEKTRERIQDVTDWYSNLSGAGRFGIGVSALIAAPIVQPVESLFNLVQQTGSIATGQELYTQDMYTYSQDVLSAISGAIQERHGTAASTAYQMIPSLEQSAGAAVAAYFTGGATEWITLAAMGMESYSSTVEDALLSGRSSKEAYALGLAAGSAEVIFEKVSLDKFVKDINVVNTAYQAALSSGKAAKKEVFLDLALDMLNHQAVQGLVEASEEGATSIANLLAERLILGYDTDYEQKKQHYMDAGMSEEEASEKAGMEIVNSVMTDMELGFVSGALMTFGSDIVQTSATTVGFDKTGTKRFLSGVHNLSAIDNEQAMEIAKTASANGIDADGELSVQGAQNIVDALLSKGADASVLAYVQNEMTSADTDRDVQTVFDSAIIKTRNDNLMTLAKAAERVAARSGITDNMSEKDAAEYKLQVAEVTNDYLLNLTQTLLTTDKAAIAEAVEMARDGYISDVMRMTGASTKAGIGAVNEYIKTTPEGVIESGATPFMSALKLAGMSDEQAAAFYANTASALVSMSSSEDFASAFTEVFGGNAAYVSDAVRNACLNSCSESSIGFVDVALAAIGTYDSISDNHLIKALAGNMDSRAYVTAMLAAAQTSKDGSSRAMYDNILKSGVTGSKLDVLSATTYYDNMKKSSRDAADKYVQSKNNDAFMTSEEVTELVNEYNSAKQNVASKQELILSHQEHNAQTMATANNIVERHMTAYNALTESELYTDANGNKVQTVSAELADQAASTYAALNDAINARDNLARANADRLASAQADLDAAAEKMRKVSRKYKMAMNRHAAAYVQLVGSQIESLKGGANPSNIEFDNIVSRAVNGTREDLNDVKSKLVAAEKRQAVLFGNEIGVEVHITDFTDEFLKEHNATNVDPKTLKGFEQKGVVYLNESFFNDADVGYGTREVITHEFGHVAEKSTKYYGAYSAFAKQYMQSKYGVVADVFEQKYGTNELVAEFAHTVLFQDPNAVKALCSEAPVMSMRLYTWLSSISSRHNGSLAQTNSLRKAQINFAKALKASKVEIRNGVQSAVSVSDTNSAINTTDNIAAEQESEHDDNYVPEAPPEDTAIAYGEEADVSNRAETSEEEPFYAPDDYRFDEAYTESDVRTVREADNEVEAETEEEEEYIPPEDYRFDEAYTDSDARNAMDRELSEDDDFSDYRFDEAYVESDARTYDMSDFFEDEQADGLNAFRSIDESYDRRTNNPSYMTSIEGAYNEFREGLHDEEYMRLAKKYMDGSISLEEEEQLAELVESAAIAAGVMKDELGAIDLYHGVDMGFGFTVFEPQPSGYAHYATTSPFVARGYAGVDETSPRELWRQPIKKNKMVSFANDFTNEELIHNAKAITGTNFEYHDGYFQDMESGELMTKEELFYYLNSERRWGRGILHLYAFPGDNQHVVDAGGKEYYRLNDTYGKSTDDIMMRSRNKASTVWFKNIKDGGFHPEMAYWNEVADEIGVQPGASNYLKSADLVTTLRGTIIPLSRRFDFSRSDIRFYTPINDAINEMSDTDYARYGNPRVMLGSNGLMVARDVSVKGFEYGNPTAEGNRNIGMVYHASKFSDGTNAFMYNDVALRDCTAVVVPKGKAYADVRNIAADNGVNVVTYNENEPTEYENALKRAASSNSDAKYFVEGIEDLMKRYGTIEQGANPRVDGRMLPRQTTKNNRVSRTMQTLAEAPITSDEGYEEIQRNILNGTGTYTPTSNAKTLSKAQSNIDRLGGARNALQSLNSSVATNEGKSTDLLALAESLYMDEAAMQSLTEYEREQLRNNMCIVAGDAGRALQLMNELKRSTPEGHIHYMEQVGNRMAQKYEKHTGKPTKLTLTNDELDAYRKAKTPEERSKIDKQVSERWAKETEDLPLLDKLRNWRYFSMLGNPRTHFRNMVGNALMYPVVRVKDTINAGYQRMFGVDKADRTTTAITKPMDAQTRAYVEAAKKEAIPLMQNVSSKYIESLNKSKNHVDEGGSKLKKVWNELTADVPSSHITNGKNAVGRALNWLSSVNSNALEMEDALALGKRFKSSFAQQLQAKGLDVTKVTPEQRQQMMNYAMQEALIATFRDASKLSDAINNLEQTNKGTQFFVSSIMPFKKTPINIAKRSIEYSPIGVVQAAYKGISNRVAYNKQIDSINSMNNISESERKARINAAENTYKAERIAAIDRLSAGTTGSIAFIIGMIAAANGWISVARKDDKSDTFENALGRNNYSLNIGDVSIDLSAFSPAAIPFIMGASLQEATDGKNDGDETMLSSIMSVLSTTLDPITEMTVLSGIGDALQNVSSSYDNPSMVNWMSGIATNAATSYVGQFVPTIVGQTARIADPYARSYSAGGDYWASAAGSEAGYAAKSLQNKIPGLAWLSEPKVDLHGEPVKNYTNFGAGIAHVLNNTILPATIKFDQKNEIDDELIRLYGVVDSDKIFPTKPSRSIGYVTNKETNKSTSLKLENDKEYAQYQKEYGQAVYDALYDLVNSMAYAQMTDEQKASAVEDVISDAQKTVRNIWKAKLAANLE